MLIAYDFPPYSTGIPAIFANFPHVGTIFSGTSGPECTSGLVQKPRHTLRPWQRWTHGWPDKAWCRIRGRWLAWSQTSWCHGCYDSIQSARHHIYAHKPAYDISISYTICWRYFTFPSHMSKCATAAGTAKRTVRCNTFQSGNFNASKQKPGRKTTLIVHPLFHYWCKALYLWGIGPWGNPEQLVAWWATHRYSSLVTGTFALTLNDAMRKVAALPGRVAMR